MNVRRAIAWLVTRLRDEPPGGRDVQHPGGGFDSARSAIEALLLRMAEWGAGSAWATFYVPGRTQGRKDVTLELGEDGRLSTLRDELDQQLCEELGLVRVGRATYERHETASPDWAELIDTLFRRHFGAIGDYPIQGRVQA